MGAQTLLWVSSNCRLYRRSSKTSFPQLGSIQKNASVVYRTMWTRYSLDDFLLEGSFTESNLNEGKQLINPCELWVDEAVNASKLGVGVILTSPNKWYTKMRAIKLESNLLNNQTKYEALLQGMEWAHVTNIKALKIFSDSQVVVNQVQDTYAIHSESLQPYVNKARQWKQRFKPFRLSLISRRDNQTSYRLAKIASRETQNEEGISIKTITSSMETCLIQPIQPISEDWVDEIMKFI